MELEGQQQPQPEPADVNNGVVDNQDNNGAGGRAAAPGQNPSDLVLNRRVARGPSMALKYFRNVYLVIWTQFAIMGILMVLIHFVPPVKKIIAMNNRFFRLTWAISVIVQGLFCYLEGPPWIDPVMFLATLALIVDTGCHVVLSALAL